MICTITFWKFTTNHGLPRAGPVERRSERAEEPTEPDVCFKFPTTSGVFEEKAATSTTSVIHQWEALVTPDFLTPWLRISDEYLNLNSRSSEIGYHNSRTGSEQVRNMLSFPAPSKEPRGTAPTPFPALLLSPLHNPHEIQLSANYPFATLPI
jgi:hypothetical protein